MFLNILDFLLNRLPFVKYLNGKKTVIAGAMIALSGVAVQIAPLLPVPYDTTALVVAEVLKQIAEVLGSVGVAGIVVKSWKMPKVDAPAVPEAPELVKKDS